MDLSSVYYTPKSAASYTHAASIQKAVKSRSAKSIQKWLQDQETYSMHRPARRRFPRRKILSSGIDDYWQTDLADLRSLSKFNNKYRYLLGCIDVFSKYAWVIPLKTKSAAEVLQAFKSILKGGRQPNYLVSDKGGELKNATLQRYLDQQGIRYFYTENEEIKASIIERFWRTLKGKMFRYFTHKGTKKYIDVLQDFVQSYNNTYHRSIKMAPALVTKENEEKVWQTLYGCCEGGKLKTPYNVGDYVRISKYKGKFDKGYLPNWSREIFRIKIIKRTQPVTYLIEDQNGEELQGSFYTEELQVLPHLPDVFRIESILAKRSRGGKRQLLVKWVGYPDSFNSWIDAADVTTTE